MDVGIIQAMVLTIFWPLPGYVMLVIAFPSCGGRVPYPIRGVRVGEAGVADPGLVSGKHAVIVNPGEFGFGSFLTGLEVYVELGIGRRGNGKISTYAEREC